MTPPLASAGPLLDAQGRALVDVRRIYLEAAAAELPRGREILARWPDADRVEVASHWQIPDLHGDEANDRR